MTQEYVRFYLALNNPEHQIANFTASELGGVVRRSLHRPLAQIAEALAARGRPNRPDRRRHRVLRPLRRPHAARLLARALSLREAADTLANVVRRSLPRRTGR
jgi:methionyl-tRNA synthetase